MDVVHGAPDVLEDRLEGHVQVTDQEAVLHPGETFIVVMFLDLLLVFRVVLEEVNEAGQQVDLRQVEQGVVHVDPLLVQLRRR